MTPAHRIAPCLWFDHQAEEAGRFYSGIFKNATILPKLMSDPDAVKAGKAMQAMLGMKKIDIAELKRAYSG
jgi:predicted 3-demethylubiquinone-9 3-methyltransferase (glyoxalase superfamily)